MPLAHSRITAQGQVSVPTKVRKKLGLGPGSVIEWQEEGAKIIVRRAGRYSSEELHAAVFGERPARRKSLADIKRDVKARFKAKYARR